MGGKQDWGHDTIRCRRAGGRLMSVGPVDESERVAVRDVMTRAVYFPCGGVYTVRDGETVVYIGYTQMPLGVRLRGARANRAPWTMADFTDWTVTLRRGDEEVERTLIEQHRPKFNKRGVTMTYPAVGRELLLREAEWLRSRHHNADADAMERIAYAHYPVK